MKPTSLGRAVLAASIAFSLAGVAVAVEKEKVDFGKREYLEKCALCHGQSGSGDGGVTDLLKVAPADLTTLAKKNGGVFPVARVYETIDGTAVVKGHGTRDMPIWGQRYAVESAPAFDDYPVDSAVFVRSRILALIDYLNRIQRK